MKRTTRLFGAVTEDEDMYLVRDPGPASAIDHDTYGRSPAGRVVGRDDGASSSLIGLDRHGDVYLDADLPSAS